MQSSMKLIIFRSSSFIMPFIVPVSGFLDSKIGKSEFSKNRECRIFESLQLVKL